MLRFAGSALLLAMTVGACKTPVAGQAPALVAPVPIFGPVIGSEVIAGRSDDGVVTLLAGGLDLVRVDVERRRVERVRLALAPGESCWGLARLSDGTLWTLKGRQVAARLSVTGRLAEQIPLPTPQFGIFAAGNQLLFQEAVFTAPSPALTSGSSGAPARVPWSSLMTRRFDGLARASAAALNLLSCGATRDRERACWFPDEPAVNLVDDDGHARRVTLAGLRVVSPEVLLTSDNPPRPVRDAFVTEHGEIWVLSSGVPPPGHADTPGGWTLARFGRRGEVLGQSRLAEAARLILAADSRRVELLLASGKVGEVPAW
ncbi:MAG TPA: hypothetical protein VGI12_07535 [Vicinamibacterales bacterium]|jgi:hypothetical protein